MDLKQYKSNADVILSHYDTDAYFCLLNKSDIKKLHEKILILSKLCICFSKAWSDLKNQDHLSWQKYSSTCSVLSSDFLSGKKGLEEGIQRKIKTHQEMQDVL